MYRKFDEDSIVGDDKLDVSENRDKIICSICFYVLSEPVLLECCSKICCGRCLEVHRETQEKKQDSTCPYCRSQLLPRDSVFPCVEASKFISAIKVRCECDEPIALASYVVHKATVCLDRTELCPQKCRSMFKRKHMNDHVLNSCPERNVVCKDCLANMKSLQMEQHSRDICPFTIVVCVNELNGCMEALARCNIKYHDETCGFRLVECDQCPDIRCQARDLEEHKTQTCIRRKVSCDKCNDFECPWNELNEHHQSTCTKVERQCKFDPTHTMICTLANLQQHEDTLCESRLVTCKFANTYMCKWNGKQRDLACHEQDVESHCAYMKSLLETQQSISQQLHGEKQQLDSTFQHRIDHLEKTIHKSETRVGILMREEKLLSDAIQHVDQVCKFSLRQRYNSTDNLLKFLYDKESFFSVGLRMVRDKRGYDNKYYDDDY